MSNEVIDAPTGFDRFGLKNVLMRGIDAAGFDEPRPIQNETITAGLDGRDVLGLAQTGTGKTAAFALPMLDRLLDLPPGGPRALVLAPTRELANQIAAEARTLARFSRLKMVTIYGGVSANNQIDKLRRGPELVVGCPGRVLDLLQQGHLKLGRVDTLVLDEADHMFDLGFLPDIRRIIAALPSERQNLLFSATMPKDIRGLADDLLHDPHVVELADASPASTIEHGLVSIAEQRKRDLLEHILSSDTCDSAIVFTRTKHRAKRLAEQLSRAGHRAVGLQGNMSQANRDRAMRGFRTGSYDVMVATDIAARGIDVSAVSHVINFDVPNTPEAYTHRIGRTGRAELSGIACTFVTNNDGGWVRATERMIGSPIERVSFDGFEPDRSAPQPKSDGRRGGGRRGGGRSRNGGNGNGGNGTRGNGGGRRNGGARGRSRRRSS